MRAVLASHQASFDIFGDHDAVIHQQAERQDDGGDRHRLQLHIQGAHRDQRCQNGERHDGAHDQARAPAQEQHHHGHHDHDRLAHHMVHFAHFTCHHVGLERHDVQLEAHRQLRPGAVQAHAQGLAEVLHTASGRHRHRHHHGRLALVDGGAVGWVGWHHPHLRQVGQAHGARAGRALDADRHLAQRLHAGEHAGGAQRHGQAGHRRQSTRLDDVLRLQLLDHRFRRQARLGQVRTVEGKVYPVFLQTMHAHALHTIDSIELRAHGA